MWAAGIRRLAPLAALFVVGSLAAACDEEGDIRVASLAFEGNQGVSESRLKAVLATKSSGWFPWSPKQYFDRAEFEADLMRLRRFYQDRGYPNARVTGIDVALNAARSAVRLRIEIDEGMPVLVERIEFDGFDVLAPPVRDTLAALPLKSGGPHDREVLAASRQQAADLLRDNGYAYAEVKTDERPGSSPDHVSVTFVARPGPTTVFGPISIEGLSSLSPRVIERELIVREGEIYRQSRIVQSQRRLSNLEILRFSNIAGRPPEGAPERAVPVRITVTENPPRLLQLGVGYGSEDRVRGSAEWSHLNFLGNARHAATQGKWSSIDRGGSVSLAQPYLYRRGLSFELGASAWWTKESTYVSRTYGGRVGVSYRIGGRRPRASRTPSDVFRTAYLYEHLRYRVSDEALDDLAGFDDLITLGLDPITGAGRGTRAALEATYDRNVTDNAQDPRRGYGMSLHLEHARPWLGGTFRYDELLAEGRAYVPLDDRVVIAGRGRFGRLLAVRDADVPFSERYFLGGSTSLRGWGRYQVAPLANGLPVGGRTMLDMSLEVRSHVGGPVGAVAFVDAGNVWAGDTATGVGNLRKAAGVGIRYKSPIGVVRADIAKQLNPIPGLIIHGEPERRRWRLHFSLGQSF